MVKGLLHVRGSADETPLGRRRSVAVIAIADRVKKNRPVTDLYKLEGVSHWPMIEDPEYIRDAIIARLDSV
ncbi:MAG: hypothetical protein O6705_09520 [Actinobacteria bacterium]|nr:hypothetical protein [Actinomycetota bacterium]